ncbi:MAG: UvrD-helicase domain-containing protein [Pirellulales bacterium]|nr:UvrD-helicase domain-containing protein [Pirellulales bacterium]
MSLNAAQHDAVNTLAGPMLVLAGAGTGKTRVVTQRIAKLIKSGTPADRILAVTFTNKAAAEMRDRAMASCGSNRAKRKPWISTFHSLCLDILKRHIARLGYPKRFTIYDRGDQESAARATLREIDAGEISLRPGDLLAIISSWKSAGARPADAARIAVDDREHIAAAAYRRYQLSLKNSAAVDFDDLLLLTDELFTRFPDVLTEEAGRFDHILVDEYQDTNGVQYRVVKAMAARHRNLCVVGDDDQSIYSWRGAEVQHILRFNTDWPDAKVIRLEENYRSTGPILAMANELIRFNGLRHEKSLRTAQPGGERPRILQFADAEAEAAAVIEEIRAKLKTKQAEPRDFAILFRTNELTRAFETELRKRDVPYVLIGGQSFFDRKEVRDVLAYLKAVSQPRDDVSLLRIINTPARGIGRQAVSKLITQASAAGKPVWEVMANGERSPGISEFQALIDRYYKRQHQPKVAHLIRSLLAETNYQRELERLYSDPNERASRWNSVEEVVNAASSYEQHAAKPRLADFLREVALDDRPAGNEKEKELARNSVVLLTLHGAKGLEFPHVYLVGMEEGILPHQKSIDLDDVEEERRLCYVGITRAQQRLTMSFPLARTKWGKPRPTIPSRFLFEMTGQADRIPPQRKVGQGKLKKSSSQRKRKPAKR